MMRTIYQHITDPSITLHEGDSLRDTHMGPRCATLEHYDGDLRQSHFGQASGDDVNGYGH